MVLEVLAELGLAGLVLFGALVTYALTCLGPWASLRRDPWRILIAMLFVAILAVAMTYGDIPDNRASRYDLPLAVVEGPGVSSAQAVCARAEQTLNEKDMIAR